MRIMLGLLSLVPMVPGHLGSGDSIRPRDTESVIESVSPALPQGVKVDIVGSDTFVRVRANGHRVEVPGYQGEPYLRITAAGDVYVNDSSTTTLLNGDRYGQVDTSDFEKSDVPSWRRIATSGSAMWHDHRSHWMSPKLPAPIDAKGTILNWVIPLLVDGTATEVRGTLYLRDRASVMWWLFGALAVFVIIAVSIAARRAQFAIAAAMALAGATIGMIQYLGLPSQARITPVMLMFSLASLSLLLISLAPFIKRATTRAAIAAGGGSMLAIGGWLCADHVQAAYVPGMPTEWLARTVVPLMLGGGIAITLVESLRVWNGEWPDRAPSRLSNRIEPPGST